MRRRFISHSLRDATIVSGTVMYFGLSPKNATYVLESREMKLKSKFGEIDHVRGTFNSSFCTYEGSIYFFPFNKFSEVGA